ncbi:hypothetical protein [Comamonas koreensis]|uniref:Uncharacterized protein n=1 Tax=Comamonas koreensis TaxID=160825 RepID=A0AAW4XSG4_9BURK|nr:hypothetical protein [Comamonas koreensis]MCD2164320.1 hypothetical protein [Comamonas koreensis]
MSDLSNMRRLARGQAAWDAMDPDYDDPPVSMAVHMELVDKFFKVRDQLAQLLEEARDLAETANRTRCCMGDRMLRLCNEIEGIEDDE